MGPKHVKYPSNKNIDWIKLLLITILTESGFELFRPMVWELLNIEKSYQIKFNKIQRKTSKLRVHSWKAFDLWDFFRSLHKFLTYGVKNVEF
jgi:hypothetical protein